jgi:hypothetical protein
MQIRGDHLLVSQGSPEDKTLSEPLNRFREHSRCHSQQTEPVECVRLAGGVTCLPKEVKPLEQLGLCARVVAC